MFRTSQMVADACAKFAGIERFGDVIHGAGVQATDALVRFGSGCKEYDRDVWERRVFRSAAVPLLKLRFKSPESPQELVPGHHGHRHVHEKKVRPLLAGLAQSHPPARRRGHLKTGAAQHTPERC